jgi:hypothetical protein
MGQSSSALVVFDFFLHTILNRRHVDPEQQAAWENQDIAQIPNAYHIFEMRWTKLQMGFVPSDFPGTYSYAVAVQFGANLLEIRPSAVFPARCGSLS